MASKLTIELVPKTSWYLNLRSELSSENWDKLRKDAYKNANYKCECCGGKGDQWPVECHEIWVYNDDNQTQTLKGLTALCPACHQVKHIGLAQARGMLSEVLEHFSEINNISITEAQNIVDEAFFIWEIRSRLNWKIDLSWAYTRLKTL